MTFIYPNFNFPIYPELHIYILRFLYAVNFKFKGYCVYISKNAERNEYSSTKD